MHVDINGSGINEYIDIEDHCLQLEIYENKIFLIIISRFRSNFSHKVVDSVFELVHCVCQNWW